MAIFNNLTKNLLISFNLKHLKKLKEMLNSKISLINRLDKVNKENTKTLEFIDSQLNTLTELSEKSIGLLKEANHLQSRIKETLNIKDVNTQNLLAKKRGYTSALQYKLSLNVKAKDNEENIKKEQLKLKQYQDEKKRYSEEKQQLLENIRKNEEDLELQKKKLIEIENAINFYSSIRNITIYSSINAILLLLCFIISNIPIDQTVLISICSISFFTIVVLCFLGYNSDRKLCKKLSFDKPKFSTYSYSILIITTILLLSLNNIITNYISIVFFALSTIFNVYNFCIIEKFSKNNNSFYLPIDFIVFSLPILSVLALYLMYFTKLSNIIIYITTGIFLFIPIMYFAIYIWILKQNKKQKPNFKYYLMTIINVIIILLLIVIPVVSFFVTINVSIASIISIVISVINLIASPIFKGIFKPSIKDPINDNDKNKPNESQNQN